MSDCTSTFETVKDLYAEFGGYAKNALGLAAAIVLENPAAAVAAVKAADKLEEAVAKAHDFWNDKIAKNSSLTIGARLLDPGKPYTGTIVSKGDRKFISSTPWASGRAQLRITESNGKGETEVHACLLDPRGKHREVLFVTFNNNNEEQKNEHQVVEKVIDGCAGQYLLVLFDGKSLTNTMSYTLEVKAL